MKDAFWLRHDSNAQHDERILELRAEFGWEGYGLFWALVERMRDVPEYRLNMNLGGLCAGLGVLKPLLSDLIQLGIEQGLFELEEEGAYFFSPSLRRRMEEWDAKRASLSEAGRLGAERKAAKKAATLKPPLSHPKATLTEKASHPEATLPVLQAEKRREEERREEPLPSVEDAAGAAALEPGKKIEEQKYSSHARSIPESPTTELRTPGGAADVGTSVEPEPVKLTKQRGGKELLTGDLAELLNPGGLAERVQKMKSPLTQAEADGLVAKYGREDARKILIAMANHQPLTRNNISANLTAQNWLDKRHNSTSTHANRPTSSQPANQRYNTTARGGFGGFAGPGPGGRAAQPIGSTDAGNQVGGPLNPTG